MSDLTDFLLARIAEDETVIREESELGAEFIIPPRRMLAEVEARRRIVGLAANLVAWNDGSGHDGSAILQVLALPYADHPDYREEWKP